MHAARDRAAGRCAQAAHREAGHGGNRPWYGAQSAIVLAGRDTVFAYIAPRHRLAPPDTLAIYESAMLRRTYPPPTRHVKTSDPSEWRERVMDDGFGILHYRPYDEQPDFVPDSTRIRLVVFADGTARIERYDGASWGALKLR